MKRELKKCPFCGGEFKFNEESERKYAEGKIATGDGYAISAECEKCGCTVYAYDHNAIVESFINKAVTA